MAGIIEPGSTVYLMESYYDSHPLKSGDLVYFRFQVGQEPVIRVVRGVPGDRFEVLKDEDLKGWKIKVNDTFLTAGNRDLVYGSLAFLPPLGLAAKTHQNRIGEDETILMSNSASGRFDSALMGLISIKDIVGKIVLDVNLTD